MPSLCVGPPLARKLSVRSAALAHQANSGDPLWSPSVLQCRDKHSVERPSSPLYFLVLRELSFSLLNLRARTTFVPGCGRGSPTPGTEKEANVSRRLALGSLLCYQEKMQKPKAWQGAGTTQLPLVPPRYHSRARMVFSETLLGEGI